MYLYRDQEECSWQIAADPLKAELLGLVQKLVTLAGDVNLLSNNLLFFSSGFCSRMCFAFFRYSKWVQWTCVKRMALQEQTLCPGSTHPHPHQGSPETFQCLLPSYLVFHWHETIAWKYLQYLNKVYGNLIKKRCPFHGQFNSLVEEKSIHPKHIF